MNEKEVNWYCLLKHALVDRVTHYYADVFSYENVFWFHVTDTQITPVFLHSIAHPEYERTRAELN